MENVEQGGVPKAGRGKLAGQVGVEPTTTRLTAEGSTTELLTNTGENLTIIGNGVYPVRPEFYFRLGRNSV